MRIYQKLFNHSNKKTNAFLKKSLCFSIILLFLIVPIKTVKSDCGTSLSKRDAVQLSFIHLDLLAWQSDYAPYLMGFQVIENYYDLGRRNIAQTIQRFAVLFCGSFTQFYQFVELRII